jgi:DNA repair photolyase
VSGLPDAALLGTLRGRGAGVNPINRFETLGVVAEEAYLDALARGEGDAGDESGGRGAMPCQVATSVLEDASRSVLNKVDSPDLPFGWTLNPYRGCEHGCIYCYARPDHEFLGLSSGLDFETKIFAKMDAPALLRKELASRSWLGEPIMLAGVTDVYQPVEADLRITRQCLEVMLEVGQPVTIITKSKLILRDLDLLRELARRNLMHVAISVTTLDHKLAAAMEPRAAAPKARIDVIRTLSHAGVPVMVMTAPIIPGLNDREIPDLLREASRAGAVGAGYVLLRLPHQIKAIFLEWLLRHFPDRAAKIESLIRQTREGEWYQSKYFERGRGTGPIAEQIRATFHLFRRKYKLEARLPELDRTQFQKPERRDAPGQLGLFAA